MPKKKDKMWNLSRDDGKKPSTEFQHWSQFHKTQYQFTNQITQQGIKQKTATTLINGCPRPNWTKRRGLEPRKEAFKPNHQVNSALYGYRQWTVSQYAQILSF